MNALATLICPPPSQTTTSSIPPPLNICSGKAHLGISMSPISKTISIPLIQMGCKDSGIFSVHCSFGHFNNSSLYRIERLFLTPRYRPLGSKTMCAAARACLLLRPFSVTNFLSSSVVEMFPWSGLLPLTFFRRLTLKEGFHISFCASHLIPSIDEGEELGPMECSPSSPLYSHFFTVKPPFFIPSSMMPVLLSRSVMVPIVVQPMSSV